VKLTYNTDINIKFSGVVKVDEYFFRNAEFVMSTYLAREIIQYIRQLILKGGSNNPQFSWGYWQKKKGGWSYIGNRKGRSFTGSWSGKMGTKYPIHPKSYFRRKVRRKPVAGQLALYDTGELYNSFRVVYRYHDSNEATIAVGSNTKKLDYHEHGTESPKRVMLAPTKKWLDKNKPLIDNVVKEILDQTNKDIYR
jgi:hypothetical protein